ncbi:TetR/AcrR family transcriptional regulator C-terminal ligand-binding domain-containing protein [Variovorax sp. J22P240]|uniref:TetR/AcrR family transcriptional regulator n=1 Tax=Variovorax sp. J22P240 TaxID=3053514 RepID=UPI0025765DC0|nr:TetR/AcrR family transcriptional regulator [Variovorax sp. J22P240]MDM0001019.1 TetR/AcrR family transcriptional regulator C-terminal ligand-binding domain-containing protein [Variovorax sp. J22P240]
MPSSPRASGRSQAPAGRPRSDDATRAVRAAALALAYEKGTQFATVERIAAHSGVAKTSIYRRWPNAASIVMDAFLADVGPKIRYRRKSSVQETFADSVRQLVASFEGPRGDLLRHVLGAAQSDTQLQRAFQENWFAPRRAQAIAVIAQAQADGELSACIDSDALVDTIYGAVYYRLMIPYSDLSTAYVETMVRQVFEGVMGGRSA